MSQTIFSPSVQGYIRRLHPAVPETWATIHDHTDGNGSADSYPPYCGVYANASESGKWDQLARGILIYDTSSLTANAVIDSAYFDYYLGTCKNDRGGSTSAFKANFHEATATAAQNADYDLLGDGNVGIAEAKLCPSGGYGTHEQNYLTDLTKINKTGNSEFGLIVGMDNNDSEEWYSDQNISYVLQIDPELVVNWHPAVTEITPSALAGTGGFLTSTVAYTWNIVPSLFGSGGLLTPTVYKELIVPQIFGSGGILTPGVFFTILKPDIFGSGGILAPVVEETGPIRPGCYLLPDEWFITEGADQSVTYSLKNPGNEPLDVTAADNIYAKIFNASMSLQSTVAATVSDAADGKIAFDFPASTLGAGTWLVFFLIDWGGGRNSVLPETGQLSRVIVRGSAI